MNPVDRLLSKYPRFQQLATPSRLSVLLLSLLLTVSVIMFWLRLVILPGGVADSCPDHCQCENESDLYYVSCRGSYVTDIPFVRLTRFRMLLLIENKIPLLERNTFVSRGMTELETLSVLKCGLRTLEVGAFNGLTKLKDLILLGNEISEIIPETFVPLKSLESLCLYRNRIVRLDSKIFRGLVNLHFIHLGANNLQFLHPDTFWELPNIQILYLGNNPNLLIPTDRPFIKSLSLTVLSISECNIISLSGETFANLTALEVLDLSDNKLRTVDVTVLTALPKLKIIFMSGNQMPCDCKLKEWVQKFKDLGIWTGYDEVRLKCETESEEFGRSVAYRGKEEEGICRVNSGSDFREEYSSIIEFNHLLISKVTTYKKQHGTLSSILKHYQLPVYSFPFIFGTACNVILLIIIICNKDMRTVPNMYIINLAVSDIIYLTVLFSEACANISDMWLDGEFMCMFLQFCRRLSVGLSAYSVAVLSIQRYRVTVYPLQVLVSAKRTWCYTFATICGVWIVAALFAVPSALSPLLCAEYTIISDIIYYQKVVIFELLVSCVLPLCVIVFTHTMTARHLAKRLPSIFHGTQNPNLNTRRNAAKIVIGLLVVFMISYLPYHAFWTYIICSTDVKIFSIKSSDFLNYTDNNLRYSFQISKGFLLINSCLNPVALFCTSTQFRQHLKRYLTCFCKTNSAPAGLELTRKNEVTKL